MKTYALFTDSFIYVVSAGSANEAEQIVLTTYDVQEIDSVRERPVKQPMVIERRPVAEVAAEVVTDDND